MSEQDSPPIPCGNCSKSLAWDEQVRPQLRDKDQRILCSGCRHLRGARRGAASSTARQSATPRQAPREVVDVDTLAAVLRSNVRAAGGIPSPERLTEETVAAELERLMAGDTGWRAPASFDDEAARELERLMDPPHLYRANAPPSAFGTVEVDGLALELEKLMGPPGSRTRAVA